MKPVPLRDAATVLLLRDGDDGLEVLMGKRGSRTRFSAGAFVFPGGAVDEADEQRLRFCRSRNSQALTQRLEDPLAPRFHMAAAREVFEESGIWLFDGPRPGQWQDWQQDVHHGRRDLATLLEQTGQTLDCERLVYFRFWTTPPGNTRRYRTRFFAARAPQDQEPRVDGTELVEHDWVRPVDMLQRYLDKEVSLIFPTLKELEALARQGDVDAAMDYYAAQKNIAEIRTRPLIRDGRFVRPVMPDEDGYEELPSW